MATDPRISTDVRLLLGQSNLALLRASAIINAVPDAVYSSTLAGTINSWNQAAERLFGVSADEAIGLHIARIIPPESRLKLTRTLARAAAREQVEIAEMAFLNGEEQVFHAAVHVVPVMDDAGHVAEVVWHTRDIRELQRLESIVWEEKERTETAFGLVTDAVVMTDAMGCITYMNAAAEQLTGLRLAEAHGQPASRRIQLVHEESQEPVESPVDICLREGRELEIAHHNALVRSDGDMVAVEDSATPLANREGELTGAVFVIRQSGRALPDHAGDTYLAGYDQVTGAVTRRELSHRLEQALVQTARDNARHALLYLRLTGYADIVSAHGPIAGREFLKHVSGVLRTQIRDMDTLATLREDEFAILLYHCPIAHARRVAGHLRKSITAYPFHWQNTVYDVDVRIGATSITADSGNVGHIMAVAGRACHSADVDGSGAVHILDSEEDDRSVSAGRSLQTDEVARALAQGRFRLYGQRITPLGTDRKQGEHCEMFLHLIEESGRIIRPSIFLPAARQAGRMVELDRWVVQSVFRMLARAWQPDITVWTVNISVESVLDESFPAYVKSQFAEYGISPQSVCFEIEEAAAIEHIGATMRFLRELQPLGFSFCLSHFGTGMNTFAYLRNLPVDYLKLDVSLIRNILDDPVNRAIVGSICLVAHVMGMRIIAGQVEDEEMFDSLRRLEVDYVQGYAVSEPTPLSIGS